MQNNGGSGSESDFAMEASPSKYGPWTTEEVCRVNGLPEMIIQLMTDVGASRGAAELCFDEVSAHGLVEGVTKKRLLAGAPRDH